MGDGAQQAGEGAGPACGKAWTAVWLFLSLNVVFYAKTCLLCSVCCILWSRRALPGQGLLWPWVDMLSEADEQGGIGEKGGGPDPAIHGLCDYQQVSGLLWTSVSSSIE